MIPNFTHWNRESVYDSLRELAFAFQKSRVLLTAMELNIFSVIGTESKSAEYIANEIKADKKSVEKLLNALCAIQLIYKKDLKYSNKAEFMDYLTINSKEFMGDLEHTSDLWSSWGDLTNVVKSGQQSKYEDISQKDADWVKAYFDSSHYRALNEAPHIVKHINLKNVNTMLDLGCGSAQYTIEILKNNPNIKATVMDLPIITEYTKQNIASANMRDKINIISGNFTSDNIGSGYDLILISNVVQNYSLFENIALLQKCNEALNKNGTAVISENIIDDNRITPITASLFALNMLINTHSGDAYSETDIWITLKEAYFKEVYRINTEFDSTLMVGLK